MCPFVVSKKEIKKKSKRLISYIERETNSLYYIGFRRLASGLPGLVSGFWQLNLVASFWGHHQKILGCNFWYVSGVGFDVLGLGFKILGLGFKVLGLGFEVLGLGFKVLGLGFEVLGLGFEVLGLGFEVLGLGFEVLGLGFEILGLGFTALGLSFKILALGFQSLCLKTNFWNSASKCSNQTFLITMRSISGSTVTSWF